MPKLSNTRVFHVNATPAGKSFTFSLAEVVNGKATPVDRLFFDKTAEDIYIIGHHWVELHLNAPPGSALRFHRKRDQVFWIGPPTGITGCCEDGADMGKEIQLHQHSATLLTIKNKNSCPQELAFNLGFQLGSDPTRIPYDPGWGNGNGGFEVARFSLAAGGALIAAGAAALAAIAYAAIGRNKGKRRSKRR